MGTHEGSVKGGATRRPWGGRPKAPRLSTTQIMGSEDWIRWLARFAIDSSVSRVELVATALAELAQRHGYPAPPPRL